MPRNSIDAPPRQANSQTSISNAALGFRSGIFASSDWSDTFFILHFSDSPLCQFLYQRSWQFLVDREVNGSFAGSEALQFVFECVDDRGSWKQAAMIGKSCIPHQYLLVSESRNTITDDLHSPCWYGRADGLAHLVQHPSCRLRNSSKIFVNSLSRIPGFLWRCTLRRSLRFHQDPSWLPHPTVSDSG